MALFFLIITPFSAALLSIFPRQKRGFLEIVAATAGVIELFTAMIVLMSVIKKQDVRMTQYFAVDALGAIGISIVAIIGCAAAFYSIGYLREEVKKGIIGFHRVREYFVLFHIFIAAMICSAAATSPILMWIALEATTISTLFLISFYNRPSSTEAAWKYLLINSIGLLLGFFGTLLFFTSPAFSGGEKLITWDSILYATSTLNPVIIKIAFIFVLIGYGTKVGLAPMHTWLPDAHSKAPSPVSALLSGALLNIAFLAIIRFKGVTDIVVGPLFAQQLLILFGVLSLAISAFIIFIQKKYKRLFAYSSIEHMGIIAIGFGFGGAASFAAILHMIYHSLVKSILFFTGGNIFLKYGTTKIEHVEGVLSTLPVTGIILFIAFLAITGVPPFGIFITEFTILTAGFIHYPFVALGMLAFFVLIFAGFLRHITSMTFGTAPKEVIQGEVNGYTVGPIVLLTILLVVLSVYLPLGLRDLIITAITPRS